MHFSETVKPKRSLGALRKANKTKPKSPDLIGQMRLQTAHSKSDCKTIQ